ncbi:MAG TPA: hypothetical protein VG826_15570 [Pirellulales bacterium]|nr:hypothetical protein [Pirellulales bacterium]
MRTCLSAVTAIAVVLAVAHARAGHFCDHCGCQRDCKKVCRLEVKEKKKKEIEYSCECEDFCVPGPSKRCGYLVDRKCKGHPQREFIWKPNCAKVYTRKKLVANEVTKEVPDYKWVVEEYCCVCGHYVKVEDKDKSGDKKEGGGKSSNDKSGDDKKKAEWPPVLLADKEPPNELHAGTSGYFWGDAPDDSAAAQPWPPVIRGSGSSPAARFSWNPMEHSRR